MLFFSFRQQYRRGANFGEIILMRVDKFLKVSRILKRRSVANQACDSERVKINGKPVKPSAQVKIGDVVELVLMSGTVKFQISDIKDTVKREEAESLYKILD